MSWFNPWDGLKTKMCRYLLQRYLGQFFENNLNLEQLKVDLYNGKAVVEDIFLKVNAFNDLFEDQGWAFEVVSGHIGCLTVVVPWNALMTNDSSLEISNLTITLRPVTRFQSGTTMLESMWSSVSSSMQMAEECMKQVDDDVPFLNHNNALIGLEKFAETIDNVLNRIRAKLTNTTLNIEYLLPRSDRKLVLSFQASQVEYKNKTGYEMTMSTSQDTETETDPSSSFNALPMIAKHNLVIEGLSLHTSEVLDVMDPRFGPTPYEQLCKIVELKGAQNIQISIKQTENIAGPKVSLELSLDDIYFMLTPRQIHLLVELSKGFNSGGQQERPKKGRSLKSAPPSEYQMQGHQQPTRMTGILGQNADWCTGMSEPEPSEYSGYGAGNAPRSVYSRSRKMSESTNSMLTSCTNTLQQELGYTEKSGEILKFKVQISKLYGVALHRDILVQNTASIDSGSSVFDRASYLRYADTASGFFAGTLLENHMPLQQQHYLLLRAAPIIVGGSQQRYFQELTSRTTLSATAVDLCEVLDNSMEHLLQFDRQRNCPDGYHIRPEIVVTQSSSSMFKQNHNRCANKIECSLDECTAELDISIYDRLGALFGCSPFAGDSAPPNPYPEDPSQTEFSVKCENLRLHLRFPVVDGRAANDPQKVPWWQKNVRRDFLALEFRALVVSSRTQISILADELDAFYCDADKQSAVRLAKCQQSQNQKKIQIDILQLQDGQSAGDSQKKPARKSPFSSKCTFGYTSHVEGLDGGGDKTDSLLPGDTEEINEFCDSCTQSSKLKVFAFIPHVKVVLESKSMYELIYNRLNGDLFMWEPRSPHYESPREEESAGSRGLSMDAEPQLEEFRRNLLLSTSAMESSIYFSMAEPPASTSAAPPPPVRNEAFSFEMFVEQGSLVLFSHLLDPESNQRTSECGKFQVNLKELRLFTVNGLDNDATRSFFCIQLGEIEALHCGSTQQDLVLAWSDLPDESLLPTIYNLAAVHQQRERKRAEVLSLVAEIKKQPEQRIKRIKMSFGISGAVLEHHSCHSEHSWLTQLIDFMDVADFPIEAYEPFALVSELQLHVWNAGIDYRPRFFPQRAFLDLGYCTLSSNIISSMSGCTLRLLAEDCVLQLGPLKEPNDSLIPVLNLGLLNISFRLGAEGSGRPKVDLRASIHDMHLKTCFDSAAALAQLIAYVANDRDLCPPEEPVLFPNEEARPAEPKASEEQEVSEHAQNHVSKLMADAVMDVECAPSPKTNRTPGGREEGIEIFYFPDEPKERRKNLATPVKLQSKSLMVESPSVIGDILDFESNVILQSYYHQSQNQDHQVPASLGSQVQQELGSLGNATLEERDFDFIHGEEVSRMDKFGVKQIYVSEEPLQIVDNHFELPHEKVDLLRPPANFPVAESSYTLCEMTFTWHLYGGRDFPLDEPPRRSSPSASSSAGGFGMSDTYKYGVSQPLDKLDKQERKGLSKQPKGSQRNPEVLVEIQLSKIRFSYESYPLSSMYSSRQVLLVSEIEVRDRLRSSDINKFLYHPTGHSLVHKPDENMVIVKALNVRPNPQKSSAEECSLRVSILPIKLNIDQDTLLFLEDFFSGMFRNSGGTSAGGGAPKAEGSGSSSAPADMPVMSVSKLPEELADELADELPDSEVKEMVERNLNVLIEENSSEADLEEDPATAPPVFFREVIFSPALPICFDYHGRRIELSRGPVTGLIMGLAQLQGSGISLREIVNRRGILGWNKLCEFLAKEWLKDIKRNQLPNILSGIGPANAVLQLFQGVYDLFRLPIEQYNKDGRIIRGFQLGAQSFTARTALAALEITSRIIHLLQFTAETTFDMLSAGPSLKKRKGGRQGRRRRQGRPKDLREGVANAYSIVRDGINESASTLIEAAITEHDQKGYSGAVGAVVRQIPQLVVCPAVLATQATTNILGGAKSSLVPEAKLEARDKWKQEIH